MIGYENLSSKIKPAPNTSAARRVIDWTLFSNDNLKFAYDLLALHYSPYEVEAMNEIARRIEAGTWLDLDSPPPPLENLPHWLKVWPFCLLWKQGRKSNAGGVVVFG